MQILFNHSEAESPTITTFYFTPEKPMSFVPGQFIELTIQHDSPDNRGVNRWFTISSAPNNSFIGITTRLVPDSSSFKKTLESLTPGDTVLMSEPIGDFVLPKDRTIPLLFVAGGIGITPYHSIAQWLSEHEQSRSIQLIHAIHSEDDIVFYDAFTRADIPITHVVSEPSSAWGGERGVLTAEHILKLANPSKSALIYIAGPEKMAETLTKNLQKLGTQKSQLITDYFPGYAGF